MNTSTPATAPTATQIATAAPLDNSIQTSLRHALAAGDLFAYEAAVRRLAETAPAEHRQAWAAALSVTHRAVSPFPALRDHAPAYVIEYAARR